MSDETSGRYIGTLEYYRDLSSEKAKLIAQLTREKAALLEEVEKHSLREAFAMRALKLIRHYDRSAKGHWKIAKAALDMLTDTDLESIDKVDPEILMRAGFGSNLKQENPDG